MKPLHVLAVSVAAHLVIVSVAVTLVGAWLHGTSGSGYAGWTGGLIVAVWTLPLAVFAASFMGAETREVAERAARPKEALEEAAVEAREPARAGNG